MDNSLVKIEEFKKNGSWMVPPNVKVLTLIGYGGGGSGGSGVYAYKGSGGGGAAAPVFSMNLIVKPNTSCTVTIGGGGTEVANGAAGNHGSPSVFDYPARKIEFPGGAGGWQNHDDGGHPTDGRGGARYWSGPWGGAAGGDKGKPGEGICCPPAQGEVWGNGLAGGGGGGGVFQTGGRGVYLNMAGVPAAENSGAGGGGGGTYDNRTNTWGVSGAGGSGYIWVVYWDEEPAITKRVEDVSRQLMNSIKSLPEELAKSEVFMSSFLKSPQFDQAVKTKVGAYLEELRNKGVVKVNT